MDATKKVMMAGSLILVWAALAVWQWDLLEAPVRVPLTNVTGPGTGGRQSDGRGTGLHVNLSLLKATAMERDATYMMPRNIFSMTSVEEQSRWILTWSRLIRKRHRQRRLSRIRVVSQSRGRSNIWGSCVWGGGNDQSVCGGTSQG